MTINIGGSGIPLPFPSALYPTVGSSVAYEGATNYVTLNSGATQVIPPGWWWLNSDGYSVIQYLDPVNQIWRGFSSARRGPVRIWSDGANFRVANLTSCPIAGVVTAQGSGYAQSTTTVTANGTGGSTWLPVIGGAVASVTVGTAGSGYTIPPTVYFPAPPYPGVQATGYATLSTGTVSAITLTNAGAGYLTAPVPVIIACPTDPNLANVVSAVATTSIAANAGKLCAVLCTNPGTSVSTVPTLTVTGAGSSGTASAVAMCTIITTSGSGGSNFTSGQNLATTVGGVTNASNALTNPAIEMTSYIPRPAVGVPTVSAGAITGFTMTDTGLFVSSNFSSNQPTLLVLAQTGSTDPSGALTISVTLGGTQSLIEMQPA